jgi:hypothetical protein
MKARPLIYRAILMMIALTNCSLPELLALKNRLVEEGSNAVSAVFMTGDASLLSVINKHKIPFSSPPW